MTKLQISEILCNIYFFKQLSLPCSDSLSLVLRKKKIRNRLREYSKIHNFVTYQVTSLMTCQPHLKQYTFQTHSWSFLSSIHRECVRILNLRVQVHPGELWVSKQWVHIVLEASKSAGAKGDVPKICGFVHPLHPL